MSYRLQVLIPEDLNARLEKSAQRTQMSKGEWVRRAIEQRLKSTGVDDPLARLIAVQAPTADIGDMLDEIDRGRRQ
jgi:hypothetical protein